MSELVYLKRNRNDIPFGFKIQGGSNFAIPLSILQVTEDSIAYNAGLRAGDAIVAINNLNTDDLEHNQAKEEIIRAGNEFTLRVLRNSVDTVKPKHTPISQLKCFPPKKLPSEQHAPLQIAKTDLTVLKEPSIKIGSSHNRAPMPFNKDVGSSSVTYQAAKPDNWQPGDYTKFSCAQKNDHDEKVTAVFHNTYNTPIGLYSDANVFDAFSNQTKSIIRPQQPPQQQQQQQPQQQNSLSMKMLNENLTQCEGTQETPQSIFDLKRGHNPTGAAIPTWFKSVQVPQALTSDEQYIPMRKEYEIKHVKQNWIEPRQN